MHIENTTSKIISAPPIHKMLAQGAEGKEITTTCYENEIPRFVKAEIDRRYGSLFSSLLHLHLTERLTPKTSTYVTRQGEQALTILLFKYENKIIKVLNEFIKISDEELHQFSKFIFSTYKSVTTISFHAIRTHIPKFVYPHQQFYCAEDIVASLPDTPQAYLKSLSKNTRRNIRRHNDAIMRSHPSYCYKIFPNEEVSEQLVRYIIELNKVRMIEKNKVSSYNDKESKWIIALTATYGLVGVVTIDGCVCAGSICCRIGDNYYMLVTAHDTEYNDFSLGELCCYQTICECIDRGGKELHFMWGRLDYKYTLMGVQQDFTQLDIYRTRADFLLNFDGVLMTALTGYILEIKFWLLDCERRNDVKSKIATKFLNFFRRSKRIIIRMTSNK